MQGFVKAFILDFRQNEIDRDRENDLQNWDRVYKL